MGQGHRNRVKDIDDQHSKVVELLNDLKSALGRPNESSVTAAVMDSIKKYIVDVFPAERRIMGDFNYLQRGSHLSDHEAFIEMTEEFGRKLTRPGVCAGLALFLYNWLITHVSTTDRTMIAEWRGTDWEEFSEITEARQTRVVIADTFRAAAQVEIIALQLAKERGRVRDRLRRDLNGVSERLTNLLALAELRVEAYGCPATELAKLRGIRAAVRGCALCLLEAKVHTLVEYTRLVGSGKHGTLFGAGAMLKGEVAQLETFIGAVGDRSVIDGSLWQSISQVTDFANKMTLIERTAVPSFDTPDPTKTHGQKTTA